MKNSTLGSLVAALCLVALALVVHPSASPHGNTCTRSDMVSTLGLHNRDGSPFEGTGPCALTAQVPQFDGR